MTMPATASVPAAGASAAVALGVRGLSKSTSASRPASGG
jgi:hypothetical protein